MVMQKKNTGDVNSLWEYPKDIENILLFLILYLILTKSMKLSQLDVQPDISPQKASAELRKVKP